MKNSLLVLLSTLALSAAAQTGLQPSPKAFSPSSKGQTQTVMLQGIDGREHQVEVPSGPTERKKPAILESVGDLENGGYSQHGCPLRIMDVSFDRPAVLLLTAKGDADRRPTLRLDYSNFSGKDSESVLLTGYLKVKENPYRLDYTIHPFTLRLSRKVPLGKGIRATQSFTLEDNAFGVDRIELSQLTYVDGTHWKPEQRSCVYPMTTPLELAKAR